MLTACASPASRAPDDEARAAEALADADPLVAFSVVCVCPTCGHEAEHDDRSRRSGVAAPGRAPARAVARGARAGLALRLDRERDPRGGAGAPCALRRLIEGRTSRGAMSDYFGALMRSAGVAPADALPRVRRRSRQADLVEQEVEVEVAAPESVTAAQSPEPPAGIEPAPYTPTEARAGFPERREVMRSEPAGSPVTRPALDEVHPVVRAALEWVAADPEPVERAVPAAPGSAEPQRASDPSPRRPLPQVPTPLAPPATAAEPWPRRPPSPCAHGTRHRCPPLSTGPRSKPARTSACGGTGAAITGPRSGPRPAARRPGVARGHDHRRTRTAAAGSHRGQHRHHPCPRRCTACPARGGAARAAPQRAATRARCRSQQLLAQPPAEDLM